MSKYIRTKDGRIIDVQKFIDEEKDTPYYYDFKFDEIKNEEDSCVLNWTAVGSKENSIKEQVGKRCQFGVTISSPFIAQSDSLNKLVDAYVLYDPYPDQHEYLIKVSKIKGEIYYKFLTGKNKNRFDWQSSREKIYGSIWVDGNLIKVAEMNEKGDLELL